jgi:hypothetical protein
MNSFIIAKMQIEDQKLLAHRGAGLIFALPLTAEVLTKAVDF